MRGIEVNKQFISNYVERKLIKGGLPQERCVLVWIRM